jgi:hypothetical protein
MEEVPAVTSHRRNWTHCTRLVTSLDNWPLWTGRNPYTSTIQTAWVASEVTMTPWWWQWLAETCWGKSRNALIKILLLSRQLEVLYRENWSYASCDYKDYCLSTCDAVWCNKYMLTFRGNLKSPFSKRGFTPKVHRTPRRTLSQLEKYKFSTEKKNHWLGRSNRINRMTLLPSRGHFRKQTYGTIPLGRDGLRHTSCGPDSKWALFLNCDAELVGGVTYRRFIWNIRTYLPDFTVLNLNRQ